MVDTKWHYLPAAERSNWTLTKEKAVRTEKRASKNALGGLLLVVLQRCIRIISVKLSVGVQTATGSYAHSSALQKMRAFTVLNRTVLPYECDNCII